MEITKNKSKYINNGKEIKQEVTYSDPYEEIKETFVRKTNNPNQYKMTGIEEKKKD